MIYFYHCLPWRPSPTCLKWYPNFPLDQYASISQLNSFYGVDPISGFRGRQVTQARLFRELHLSIQILVLWLASDLNRLMWSLCGNFASILGKSSCPLIVEAKIMKCFYLKKNVNRKVRRRMRKIYSDNIIRGSESTYTWSQLNWIS